MILLDKVHHDCGYWEMLVCIDIERPFYNDRELKLPKPKHKHNKPAKPQLHGKLQFSLCLVLNLISSLLPSFLHIIVKAL